MKDILLIVQMAVSIALIIVIILQAKGTGLGAAFGGDSTFYRTKRGVEKFFVYLTIFLTILFLLLAITLVII